MDLEIYCAILRESGIDPNGYDKTKLRKYGNGERTFRHDIFKGKVIWQNDYLSDYLLFLACYHPLIGLFASRKHHPYTKRKRLITLSMMLCVGSFFAALSSLYDAKYSHIFHIWMAYKLIVSMGNGIILFIMELMLRFCQQCPCRENIESNYCNKVCKLCTKSTLGCWSIISFSLLLAMIIIVCINDLFSGFIIIFILQFFFSWLMQCVGLFLKFRKLWKKDVEHMKKLPASDPYRNIWSTSRATFTEYIENMTFKELLKERKKAKFPYYITFFDSNKWIEENPQYLNSKKMGKCSYCWRLEMQTSKNMMNKEHISVDEKSEDDDVDEDIEVNDEQKEENNINGGGVGSMDSMENITSNISSKEVLVNMRMDKDMVDLSD